MSNFVAILLLMCSAHAAYADDDSCASPKKNNVYKSLQSSLAGCITLRFNVNHEVWLATPSLPRKKYVVVKIPSDRSPALNDEVRYMGFFTNTPVLIAGQEYLPLYYLTRSRSGGFGGECGTGTEGYLVVLKVTPTALKKVFTKLVSSCEKGIAFDVNAARQAKGPVYLQGEFIFFDWFTHPDFEKSPVGKIHLSDGTIEYLDAVQ